MTCLVDGNYQIKAQVRTTDSDGQHGGIEINGTVIMYGLAGVGAQTATNIISVYLKRGDYIRIRANWNSDSAYTNFEINRIG